MKVGLGVCALLTLGLIACGGATGSSAITGDSPAAIRTSPAGIATQVFMDLEALRPDLLAQAGTLPNITVSVSNGVATYTFNNYTAANGGTAAGTITVSVLGTTFTETFNNVKVTTLVPASATTPATTQVWTYSGTQVVTVTGTSATVSVAPSLTVTFTDSATPANNKSYAYTANLGENWTTTPVKFMLTGTYAFTRTVETISGTIAGGNPLVWNTCEYPSSGTLALSLVSSATGTDALNVGFGPACGQATIGGTAITLGGN